MHNPNGARCLDICGLEAVSPETQAAAVFLWCLTVAPPGVFAGSWFSTDLAVIAAVAAIPQPMLLLYTFSGPILLLALYFHALGQPGRTGGADFSEALAAMTPLLIAALSAGFGVLDIWLAFPMADAIILLLGAMIGRSALQDAGVRHPLRQHRRRNRCRPHAGRPVRSGRGRSAASGRYADRGCCQPEGGDDSGGGWRSEPRKDTRGNSRPVS